MPTLWAFLAAAVGPLAKRLLAAIGFGLITYAALTALVASVVSAAQSAWGGVAGAALQLSSLGGIPEVLGIITGALVARVAYNAVGHLGKLSA